MALNFDTPPPMSLWPVALKRGAGGAIPYIEANAARLVGDPTAYARVCGYPVVNPLPLTWPVVLLGGLQLAVMTAPEFPLRLAGIVHVRQQITRRRHLRPDEPYAGRCWVEGHRVVKSGGEFDLHNAVLVGGEEVWHGVTTILSRAIPGDGIKRPSVEEPAFRVQRSVTWTLPADLGRRYAAVSGDYNPIHLSPWTSKLFGFSRPIAHGWWSLARILAEMDQDVPEACSVDVRFRAPVPLPTRVSFESGPTANGMHFELRRKDLCLSGEVRPL